MSENAKNDLEKAFREISADLTQARGELEEILNSLSQSPPDDPEEKRILEEEVDALREEITALEEDIRDLNRDAQS